MTASAQLYVTLEIGGSSAAIENLALGAVIAAAHVTSILLRPKAGTSLDPETTKSLIERAQKKGLAALVADDANLARMVKADGLHISWSKEPAKRYSEAREILGPRAMIGVDAGRSRHDAMLLGEAGADYVAFGIPGHVEDRATAEERQRDLIAWWSEIFEVPCVAFDVVSADHAHDLSRDGADFIAVTVSSNMSPQKILSHIVDCANAITVIEVNA